MDDNSKELTDRMAQVMNEIEASGGPNNVSVELSKEFVVLAMESVKKDAETIIGCVAKGQWLKTSAALRVLSESLKLLSHTTYHVAEYVEGKEK